MSWERGEVHFRLWWEIMREKKLVDLGVDES